MSLGDGSGLSAADVMALAGNNNNNDGFGAGFGGAWWLRLSRSTIKLNLAMNTT